MGLGTILLIVLLLMLFGAIPTWPHSRSWGLWAQRRLGIAGRDPAGAVVDGAQLMRGRAAARADRLARQQADFTAEGAPVPGLAGATIPDTPNHVTHAPHVEVAKVPAAAIALPRPRDGAKKLF